MGEEEKSDTDLMDWNVYTDGDTGDDLDEAVHPLGRTEHEEDRGEEL